MHIWQGSWKFKYKQVLCQFTLQINKITAKIKKKKVEFICTLKNHCISVTQREQSMSHPTEEKHDKSEKWKIVTWTRWKGFIPIIVKSPELLVYSRQ